MYDTRHDTAALVDAQVDARIEEFFDSFSDHVWAHGSPRSPPSPLMGPVPQVRHSEAFVGLVNEQAECWAAVESIQASLRDGKTDGRSGGGTLALWTLVQSLLPHQPLR